jgi:hypothetical protein
MQQNNKILAYEFKDIKALELSSIYLPLRLLNWSRSLNKANQNRNARNARNA